MRRIIATLLVANLALCISVAIDRSEPLRLRVGPPQIIQPKVIPGTKKCERVAHSRRDSLPIPTVTVVTHPLHIRDFTLRPPRSIGHHVPASVAWHHVGLILERRAHYRIYLTRISSRFPRKNGVSMLHRTPAWVILMRGAAGPENSTGPLVLDRTPPPIRACIFYNSPLFAVVLAKSGRNFESGG